MAITVQELVEQFQQLDADQQDEALALINRVRQGRDTPFDFAEWSRRVDAIHERIKAEHGADYVVGALDLLEELREEASEWPFGE